MKSSLSLAGIFLFGFMLGASAFLNGHMLTSSSPQLIKKDISSRQMSKNTIHYAFGGDPSNKPKITRDNENEAFVSEFEKKSTEEKLKDPILLVGLFSVLSPFILFVIFYAFGLIGF
mmetsp:Transcript_16419/g.21716  ORF Transcript_16419/g.21716 Transcript_16419/m.21716 type:complete len:117 (+) Transcript_16419:137-487(+)|eukprot:CAMPEP_0117755852 /NCGR_PEP_ID=MMETSP0947-20121206/13698_1 /TAXON_ID=44440 /ORGANISM="Chattonella subsalsa, Strain CCMP2191" /LENGTH=116 /DNA_ID=CAMNT_0005575265 /DNA_START=70 /DNA_END=420 /DNA_ORIENTATION=-